MPIDPLTAAFELGKAAINKIWANPEDKARALKELKDLQQKGDLEELNAHVKLMLAQIDVNKIEASNKSIFVAGWRPFIGWVGGFSLAYSGVVHPILEWVFTTIKALGYIPAEIQAPPYVESGVLGAIVSGMLGIGTMRSYDKKKGTQTDKI